MRARPGDQILIKSHQVGKATRRGEIVEVRGAGGEPPFVVRWSDSDHAVLFFPGPDTEVGEADDGRRR